MATDDRVKYNRLTLIRRLGSKASDGRKMALWLCDCGRQHRAPFLRVKSGVPKSCGCLRRESKPNLKHGMKGSPEYSSWVAMNNRCHSHTSKDYPRYGAKGIAVCDRWHKSFEEFYADVGPRPRGTTLDRYPNYSGNYEPGNVRWATAREQAHNRKDFKILDTPLGRMGITEYGKRIGITRGAVAMRLGRGKLNGCHIVEIGGIAT